MANICRIFNEDKSKENKSDERISRKERK